MTHLFELTIVIAGDIVSRERRSMRWCEAHRWGWDKSIEQAVLYVDYRVRIEQIGD